MQILFKTSLALALVACVRSDRRRVDDDDDHRVDPTTPSDSYARPSPAGCANKWAKVLVSISAAPTYWANHASVTVPHGTIRSSNPKVECENSSLEVSYTPRAARRSRCRRSTGRGSRRRTRAPASRAR